MQEESSTIATLVCGESEFKADRVVLSTVSPYFQSAFSNGWVETAAGRVVLPTIRPKSMKIILECINTGQVNHIPRSKDELWQLVEDADYLQLDELVRLVFSLLASQQLTISNFRELYGLSHKLNNNQYCTSQVLVFLAENFSDLTKCNDFLRLNANELNKILQQQELHKYHTERVFTGILCWTMFEESRVALLEDFLKILEDHGWCSTCLNNCIKENITKTWSSSIVEHLRTLLAIRNSNSFACQTADTKQKLLVFGYTASNRSIMSTYDKNKNQWIGTQILPFELEDGMSVGAYGCHVFFFGGENSVDAQCEPEYDELYYDYDESLVHSEESVELNDHEQYYECVELGESDIDDRNEEYYDYDDCNQQYDITNHTSTSSRVIHFLFSFFKGNKGRWLCKETENSNAYSSNKFIMTCFNILNRWAVTKVVSLFLSTFDHTNIANCHKSSIEYHTYDETEDEDDSSQCEYYEYEEEDVEENCSNAGTSKEECEIKEDEAKSNGDLSDDECYVEGDEVEDISEELLSDEDTGAEEYFESSCHEDDSDEEYEEDNEDSNEGEEEYEEDYEEVEYDEEYDELLEEFEDDVGEASDDEDVLDEEDVLDDVYCRVCGNNIEEWNRIIVYCPATNAILKRVEGSLRLSVCLAGAGVLRGCIYIVNGINEHYAMVKHVQCFNPRDYSCDLVAFTNKAHCSPHVMSVDDGLYILGSFSRNDKAVEHYDVLSNQWTVVIRLPRVFDFCYATICQKKLFLLRKGFCTHFHIYDLGLRCWTTTEYQGGPSTVQWVTSAEGQEKPMLLAYDSANVIHQYDVESALWVTESKQNLSLKNCLFTFSI